MIHYKCKDCGTPMEAPNSMAGETESCPACGAPNTVTGAQEQTEGTTGQTMTTSEWLKREWFKLGLLVLLVPAVWYIALNGIVIRHDFPSKVNLTHRGGPNALIHPIHVEHGGR